MSSFVSSVIHLCDYPIGIKHDWLVAKRAWRKEKVGRRDLYYRFLSLLQYCFLIFPVLFPLQCSSWLSQKIPRKQTHNNYFLSTCLASFKILHCSLRDINPYRPALPFGNRKKLEDLLSSVLSKFKKHHPSGNLKFNNLGISQSLKLRNLIGKILRLSSKLNFTSNNLGCYGLSFKTCAMKWRSRAQGT